MLGPDIMCSLMNYPAANINSGRQAQAVCEKECRDRGVDGWFSDGTYMLRVLRLSHHGRAADSRGQHHVAVAVPMTVPVAVTVAVTVAVAVGALLVLPLPWTKRSHHLLVARHGVGLHERHAGQHRLTAQQPSLSKHATHARTHTHYPSH